MLIELLNDIRDLMESRFPLGVPTNLYCSITGDQYIVLTSGGISAYGEHKVLATDIETAAELFISEFYKYSKDKVGVLYWRRIPSLYEREHFDALEKKTIKYYSVTARFIITDKPALASSQEEFQEILANRSSECSI